MKKEEEEVPQTELSQSVQPQLSNYFDKNASSLEAAAKVFIMKSRLKLNLDACSNMH